MEVVKDQSKLLARRWRSWTPNVTPSVRQWRESWRPWMTPTALERLWARTDRRRDPLLSPYMPTGIKRNKWVSHRVERALVSLIWEKYQRRIYSFRDITKGLFPAKCILLKIFLKSGIRASGLNIAPIQKPASQASSCTFTKTEWKWKSWSIVAPSRVLTVAFKPKPRCITIYISETLPSIPELSSCFLT